MEFRNVSREVLENALDAVNEMFGGNITWKRSPEHIRNTRQGGPVHLATLTVKDSSGPGARRSRNGRRIAAACWHAHGELFDAVWEREEMASIVVAGGPSGRRIMTSPADNWEDQNIGSNWYPFYFSEACEC